jgi:hypothetical protein
MMARPWSESTFKETYESSDTVATQHLKNYLQDYSVKELVKMVRNSIYIEELHELYPRRPFGDDVTKWRRFNERIFPTAFKVLATLTLPWVYETNQWAWKEEDFLYIELLKRDQDLNPVNLDGLIKNVCYNMRVPEDKQKGLWLYLNILREIYERTFMAFDIILAETGV